MPPPIIKAPVLFAPNHGGPVSDINISKKTTISGIFDEMAESGGFESVNMAEGLDILESMMSDEKCVKFVSFVGALVSTGLRGIIKDMMRRKHPLEQARFQVCEYPHLTILHHPW